MLVAVKHIDEIKSELQTIRAKKEANQPDRGKRNWYGLVYCDSNGWASIIGDNLEGIWLGKTDEIIPYLRSRRIDGENVDMVLQAIKQLHSKEEFKPHKRPRFFGMDGYVPLPPYPSIKAEETKPRKSKSQSYHLATKNDTSSMFTPGRRSHRITLKKDPLFLASLDELVSRRYGIPTIQKELKYRGYDIAYATLGRWVRKCRATI